MDAQSDLRTLEEGYLDRASSTIEKAVALLRDAAAAFKVDDVKTVEAKLWEAAAELEYVASVLSVLYDFGEIYPDSKKRDDSPSEGVLSQICEGLLNLLGYVKSDPKRVYGEVRIAIHGIRRVQVYLRARMFSSKG